MLFSDHFTKEIQENLKINMLEILYNLKTAITVQSLNKAKFRVH